MTKEEINEAISKGLYNRLGDECLKLDQQNKELTEEVSKLENTLRVQGNVILKLTDAEREITQLKTKLEEANKEVERFKEFCEYVKEHHDGVGIALGYNSDKMLDELLKH